MEADIELKLLQMKDHVGPPAAGRDEEGSSLRHFRGSAVWPTP